MENNPIPKKTGEVYDIVFSNPGSTGFSIQWEISDTTVATVERLESIIAENIKPGDAIQVKYRIHFQKKGNVILHFYQTRIWDNTAPKITLSRLSFTIE